MKFFTKLALTTSIVMAFCAVAAADSYYTYENGKLERPQGYRDWPYVGTPLTPNDMNGGKAPFPEFHTVYIDPVSWAHWKETGEIREGAILVKELISVGVKSAPSGQGYFMGEFLGLEATIKSEKLFPNEPGHWAYFTFSRPDHETLERITAPEPVANCNECHRASAASDFVFTQYYPAMRATKGTGEAGTGGKSDELVHLPEIPQR